MLNTTTTGGEALTLAPGANLQVNLATNEQSLNVASLALQGTTTVSTNSYTNNVTFNFGAYTNQLNAIVNCAGALTTSNSVVINIGASASPTLTPGQFPLIKYAGSIQGAGFGAFSLGTIPANSAMTLVDNVANHSVDINITVISGPPKVWVGYANGAANSTWDINTTTNWYNTGTLLPDVYTETAIAGDSVRFDDTASNFVVNVSTAVKPASITVNNTNNDYVISGSPITSVTALSKTGTRALTLIGNNTFSNGVVLSAGTLRVGSGTPLGTGLLTFNSSGATLSSDGIAARQVANAVLVRSFANFSVNLGDPTNNGLLTLSGPMNFSANTPTFNLFNDAIFSGGSSNGAINLSSLNTNNPNGVGTNTLTLQGVHSWTGAPQINSGNLVLDGALVTNSSGALAIYVNQTNGLARLAIINGGALVETGTNVTARLGNSNFGNTTAGGIASLATNELDVAGLFATPNSTASVIMGRSAALSVINLLPGGNMQVGGVTYGDIAGNRCPTLFNFNGGTLSPTTNSVNFMPYLASITTAYVLAGGAILDTRGYNITVNQPLLTGSNPDGGLTKNGAGTLTLTGANTYTGSTSVNQGELYLPTAATGGGAIVVNDAGSLGVIVTAAAQTLNAASITLGATAGHNGTLDFNLGGVNPTAVPLACSVSLSANGINTINLIATNALSLGQFPLISYAGGSLAPGAFSSFQLGTLPAGNTAVLVNNTANNSIDVNITTGVTPPVRWYGYYNNTWDIGLTANWFDVNNALATYTESNGVGAPVIFNDLTGSYTVDLAANVSPVTVTVNNSASDYSITGGGYLIGGTGSLTKSGTAGLFLSSSNAYSGGTTVSSGIVRLGADGALGTGLLTLSGGALSSDGPTGRTLLNSVSITATNPTILGDSVNTGQLNLAGTFNWNNAGRTLNIASAVVLSGGSTNGGFGKTNTGVLTVQGVHSLHYFCDDNQGDVVFDGANVISTAGSFLRVYCRTPNDQARVVVTNGAALLSSNAPTAYVYIGYYGNTNVSGNVTSTNLLELSGLVATFPGASAFMGASCALAQVDLLAGGILEVGAVQPDPTTNSALGQTLLNFNGGTLRANASSTNFLGGLTNVFVLNGGAVIDSSSYDITVTQPLIANGSGGLTKLGTGSLTLNSGANTYTGLTTVSNGTLLVNSAIAGATVVQAAASLGGSGTLGGSLTLAAGAFATNNEGSPLTVTGALIANNNTMIVATPAALGPGDYTLMTYNTAGSSGTFNSSPVISGAGLANSTAGTIVTGGGIVKLHVVSAGPSGSGIITNSVSGNILTLTWPAGQTWRLVGQTNNLSTGLNPSPSAWFTVPGGIDGSNSLPINPANPAVFYKLVSP